MTAGDVVDRVLISQVWASLGGGALRHGRGQAFWRDGDGFNVSLSDAKGTWFDHVAGKGGGIVDLVAMVRGGTRADALRWCADLAGVPLDDAPASAADRAKWARERREIERDLPGAHYWRRTAVALCDEKLTELKSRLFDPLADAPGPDEIAEWTREHARLSRLDGADLVRAYREALRREPRVTAGMVRWARDRERTEIRALLRYLELDAEARAA